MKMRLGFVSNSSSSSFIIECEDKLEKDTISIVIREEYPVKKLDNVEELEEWFTDKYDEDWRYDEDYKSDYEKYKKMMKDGKEIMIMEVSNEEDSGLSIYLHEQIWEKGTDNWLENVIIPENIKIIDEL